MQHLAYPGSSSTQSMGAEFILKQLNGASSAAGSAAADCTDAAPAASSKSKRQFGGLDKLKGMFGGGASASSEGSESTEASASTEAEKPHHTSASHVSPHFQPHQANSAPQTSSTAG